ncbi:MAG: hypothetical protein MUD14_17220 [Hydrococcus sp. Prado102]|jgi:hypothetical protein|nr:hypothetical protein [Hydrococcus sp. Prado102]
MDGAMISQKFRRWQYSLFSLFLGIGLIGCNSSGNLNAALSNPSGVPISQLQQQGASKVVYLKGKVGDRAPFLGSGAYQLQDDTGTVWVVTQGALPASGDIVSIKGEAKYETIAIGQQKSQEFYILELEQLERQAQTRSPQQ